MMREQRDCENLLAEAKTYVERASFRLTGRQEEVLVGFRRDSAASFYFGAEPVYHFTSKGQLRRAFVNGSLFKAEHGQLVSLDRQPGEDAVHLVSHLLDARETQDFMDAMHRELDELRAALVNGQYEIAGQVPPDGNLPARIRSWLERFAEHITVAQSPRSH